MEKPWKPTKSQPPGPNQKPFRSKSDQNQVRIKSESGQNLDPIWIQFWTRSIRFVWRFGSDHFCVFFHEKAKSLTCLQSVVVTERLVSTHRKVGLWFFFGIRTVSTVPTKKMLLTSPLTSPSSDGLKRCCCSFGMSLSCRSGPPGKRPKMGMSLLGSCGPGVQELMGQHPKKSCQNNNQKNGLFGNLFNWVDPALPPQCWSEK